jgi:hypothetical protein
MPARSIDPITQGQEIARRFRDQVRASNPDGAPLRPGFVANAETLGAAFPDFAIDGFVLDPETGNATPFSFEALEQNTYVPPGAEGRATVILSEGANQWGDLAAARSQRMADNLGLPIVAIHNASLVNEDLTGVGNDTAEFNRSAEIAATILLGSDLISEGSVENLTAVIERSILSGEPIYLSGYSQGAILVGQALNRAKDTYIAGNATTEAERALAAELWEEQAGRTLNILTFGNVYDNYPEGPNYLHVMMRGDSVVDGGTTPSNTPASERVQYLVFDQLFPGENNFENHNIMFLIELMRETMTMNGLPRGDLAALFAASKEAFARGTPLVVARPDEVNWPGDMQTVMWDANASFQDALNQYTPPTER